MIGTLNLATTQGLELQLHSGQEYVTSVLILSNVCDICTRCKRLL